jgi:hypothetical protein
MPYLNMITNIYLDIDGVLIGTDHDLAFGAHDFLVYLTSHYPVFWLTTHCRGDISYTNSFLKRTFPPKTYEIVKQIIPTTWRTNKTEAIDFSKPFLWFDDNLFAGERAELTEHDVLENWIEVDLRRDKDFLMKIISEFPIPINMV